MPQPSQTREHQVYLVDQYGDTLVVRPRGDAAGFTTQAVTSEMTTITTLAQMPDVKNVLIDLSGTNYVGSVILGALVQLNQTLRARGVRTGMCGASSDMLDVLRLMKLDQLWEQFPTLADGLRIARIPLRERLWRQRQRFAVVAIIAAVIAGYIVYPRPDYAKINYAKLTTMWQEAERAREMAGEEEWSRLQKRFGNELESMVADMERRGKQGKVSMAERFLVYIARDCWKHTVDRNHPQAEAYQNLIRRHFRTAEALMERRPMPQFDYDTLKATADPPASSNSSKPE
jgi:anti-anti-sigma factor